MSTPYPQQSTPSLSRMQWPHIDLEGAVGWCYNLARHAWIYTTFVHASNDLRLMDRWVWTSLEARLVWLVAVGEGWGRNGARRGSAMHLWNCLSLPCHCRLHLRRLTLMMVLPRRSTLPARLRVRSRSLGGVLLLWDRAGRCLAWLLGPSVWRWRPRTVSSRRLASFRPVTCKYGPMKRKAELEHLLCTVVSCLC